LKVLGFAFRYRLGQGQPTVMTFPAAPATLAAGDIVGHGDATVQLGDSGDHALIGAVTELLDQDGLRPSVRVVVDSDAVYGVEDPHARVRDVTLKLGGSSGEQGVSENAQGNLTVVLDCRADEETLVRISIGSHHALTEEADGGPVGGELNAAIARALVRHHREHLGRGPTRAQAFYRQDVVVVVLREIMTKAERTLAAAGRPEAVTTARQTFQEAMRDELVDIIEDLTQCKVLSFMSGNDVEADMSCEVFVLDRPVPGRPAGDV
jgi:uncharacterized protein YbcI